MNWRCLSVGVAFFVSACEGVPDLVFVADDASLDAASATNGGDATGDSGDASSTSDGGGADSDTDGGVLSGCNPNQLPPGVTACCGSTACIARSDGGCADCSACNQKSCGTGFCCVKDPGNASCKALASDCH